MGDHRQNIIWHKSYQCFLRSDSQGSRNENKQMRPNQTYKLLHSKGNHKNNKKQEQNQRDNLQNGRKYLQTKQPKRINLHNILYKQLMQLNWKKQTSKWIIGGRSKETFLQRRHTDGQKAYERMPSIINY